MQSNMALSRVEQGNEQNVHVQFFCLCIIYSFRLVLLEAQAATGSMINPITGERMSVEEAYESGLIDSKYFDALQRAQKAVTGFEDPVTHEYLSLYECMKKGYIVESHGIR